MPCAYRLVLPVIVAVCVTGGASAQTAAENAADAARFIELLSLRPGMVVADIGAGGGLMTLPIARHLGASGRIYATDVNPQRLTELRALAAEPSAAPIVVVEGGSTRTNLPEGCCDALFIRNVYHHFAEPPAINASMLRALKPGAPLAIADFAPDSGVDAPPGRRDVDRQHGITAATLIAELTAAGFADVRQQSWPSGGLYVVTARRPPSAR